MIGCQEFCVGSESKYFSVGEKGLGWLSTNKALFIKQTVVKTYLPLMLINPDEMACQCVFHMTF